MNIMLEMLNDFFFAMGSDVSPYTVRLYTKTINFELE